MSEMKEKEHLPFYGPGPLYGAVVIGLTVLAVINQSASYYRQSLVYNPAFASLDIHDLFDESHRGEMAQRSL